MSGTAIIISSLLISSLAFAYCASLLWKRNRRLRDELALVKSHKQTAEDHSSSANAQRAAAFESETRERRRADEATAVLGSVRGALVSVNEIVAQLKGCNALLKLEIEGLHHRLANAPWPVPVVTRPEPTKEELADDQVVEQAIQQRNPGNLDHLARQLRTYAVQRRSAGVPARDVAGEILEGDSLDDDNDTMDG